MRQVNINYIFKQVIFGKGEGTNSITNNVEEKIAIILKLGKSHKKSDLTKMVGCKYNIMILTGYCKDNMTLTDRAIW